MADVNREEIDAKLAAVEARLETRLVGIESKLDRFSDRVFVELKVTQDAAQRSEAESRAARNAASGIKWNILFTALAVLGLVYGVWQLWSQAIEMVTGLMGI